MCSSIFFFTTYFSDYILVPSKSRPQVIHALEERGFTLNRSAHAYVNRSAHHARTISSHSHSSTSSDPPLLHSSTASLPTASLPTANHPPSTPPPTSLTELQTRTFALLKRRAIAPRLHPALRLLHCAGRPAASSPSAALALLAGITACLLHAPTFFALTLTHDEAPSLLLDTAALARFPSPHETLLGAMDEFLVPVTLDLAGLEAPGIVCGVAGRLVGGGDGGIEMSYLSTAQGAAVLVPEGEVGRTVELLGLERGGE